MNPKTNLLTSSARRTFMRTGVLGAMATMVPMKSALAAGATDDFEPYPIPWLDANMHHNQVPTQGGKPVDLSHIWHFKGQIGRALLEGSGITGDGQTLYIGSGTDYGYSQGNFITASGRVQAATFSHV